MGMNYDNTVLSLDKTLLDLRTNIQLSTFCEFTDQGSMQRYLVSNYISYGTNNGY